MATNTMPLPTAGTANTINTQDNIPGSILIAEATGTNAPAQPAPIPAAPGGEVHVAMPADQTVVRVQVAPGETIDLPFDGALAAKFGNQGNLAIKVGDQTIILLGYGEANQQQGVTLHDSHGHPIDVAAVVAQTDPNLDIQTAAGPAAGPAGGQGGHLFFGFAPGDGLGGLGELGVINPTELQYKLIQPDQQILLTALAPAADHTLTISSTDGGAISLTESLSFGNRPLGDASVAQYLLHGNKEGKAIQAGLVNGVDPANLTAVVGTDVTVTFKGENAKNHNIVGVYAYDAQGNVIPGSVKFIWLDASTDNSGNLVTDILGHTQSLTVDLGQYAAGTKLGFFLVENGAGDANDVAAIKAAAGAQGDVDALNSVTSIVIDNNGVGHVVVNGQQLESTVIFTSNTSWNNDGGQHAASGVSDNPADGLLYIGFEDKDLSKSDKDYNDVVFGVDLGGENTSKVDQQVFSPQIKLGDSVNDVSQITIVPTAFQANDRLVYAGFNLFVASELAQAETLAAALGFNLAVDQNGKVTITETTTHTTAQWQDFVNHIEFASNSQTEGQRDLTYTASDSSGHSASTTAHVDVVTTHHDSLTLSGVTSDNGNVAHNVTWGGGDDILYLDKHAGFVASDKTIDLGAGFNTVQVGLNNVGFSSADSSHVKNVDEVNLTGFGANTVSLKASDVISMTDSSHTLRFDGDSGDKVNISGDGAGPGHWTQSADVNINGTNYHQFEWHNDASNTVAALVQINEHLTANLTS
jgi:hypothetical protein